jgi:PKD repeat protein
MSTERAPVHTYQLVGAYDVMVTASGPAGAIPRVRKDLVEVAAGALGATCDVDAHCAMGLACLCGSATTCPAAFSRGLCSVACSDGACPAGAVCADLSPPAGSPGANLPAPWQRPSCLAACSRDADCGPGLSCRDLPARAAATDASAPPPSSPLSWVKGCFPPYPLDVGSPCRAADGHLRSDVCASGDCIDFGSAGLCTAPCLTDADCPSATVCATFGDGRALCLRSCAGVAVCTVDPLLDCESPGAAGPLGFTVAGAVNNPTATYCAPRGCISAVNCSPAGVCAGGITAGHCVSQ